LRRKIKMLRGTLTALVTPFKKEGSLDEDALRKLVDFQVERGIDGLVPCGTTGESPTLSYDEHNRVIDIVIEQAAGRVPVIAGTGANSTREAVELTKHALEAGANYSLQVTPYYNKPTQEGLYRHFMEVADVGLPIVVYNIKGRTGINIETPTLMRIAKHEKAVAVKEASGDIKQMMDVITQRPDDFSVLSGDDNMTYPLIALGGDGVVSVVSNLMPEEMRKLVHAALDGDYKTAREMHYRLMPIFKGAFIETNPIPIKAAMAMKGMCEEVYRLPMCEMQPENKEKLRGICEELGVL
jgi:4-hydroxy-tetrahydrodipicolinate synthase